VLGVGQSMSSLARILGPLLGLSLQDYGIAWPYWAAAGLMAVCVVLVCGLRHAVPVRNVPATADAVVG
jgi:MFS transporter, DHA1 family, tetracycline resistance protein